ncbi:glycosyl transferase [Serratia sp. Je.1.23.a]|uniref:glycosyl transferase n=1 Tax=Serratia sp. Je.1.23.a TaxID=3142841 RepID=UPI003DA8AE16
MTHPADIARVFIGCDPNDCDLEQMMVLEYSLRKHASIPVQIVWMQLSRDPASFWFSNGEGEGWTTECWATPFSAFRWGIPAYCNFQGRAFYSDADVLYLSDIAEIWHHPMEEGTAILAAGTGKDLRLGEMLWDCEAAARFLPSLEQLRGDRLGHKKMQQFFEQHPEFVAPLKPEYSNLDGDDLPVESLKAIHYSDMGSQFSHHYSLPRLKAENRQHWFDGKIYRHYRDDLRELFEQYYHEALQAGYTLEQYRNVLPYGRFNKQSQEKYDGNPITRKKKPFLQRVLRSLLD